LGLPPSVRIHFAVGLVDMRKGIDGLRAIVDGVLKRDPYEGHLFVFVGKSRDKVKILFWDRNGFVVYMKRLEQGRFQLPTVGAGKTHIEMEPAQLAMLLDGIDLTHPPRAPGPRAASARWGRRQSCSGCVDRSSPARTRRRCPGAPSRGCG
jgi:transposase